MPNIMEKARGERLILLYQNLPKGAKNAKTLSELLTIFNPTGEKVKSRAKLLEQDLLSLYSLFGKNSICRIPTWAGGSITGKTPKYYLHPNFTLDSYDNENLFFWEMLDKFTANFLPKDIHNTLTAKIANVKNHQNLQYQASQLGQWKTHLYTLPSLLQAPKYDDTILNTVHQAIIARKRLKIRYLAKWATQPVTRWVYPKGLIFIDNMIYLTAFYKVEESISTPKKVYLDANRNYAVIRIQSAQILEEAIPNWVKDLSLEKLSQKGMLETHLTHRGKFIELKLKINPYAAQHLTERPLSDNQTLERIDEKNLLLTATVMNTLRLEDWLVSMSHMSEVIEPVAIREAIKNRLLDALTYYQ
jgi:predicted DNA-binding transcriptional regulator YafY